MDLHFYGANCLTIATKHVRLSVDNNLSELGGKSIAREGDVAIFSMQHGDPSAPPKLVIDMPGEYEVAGVSIHGIAARGHMDEAGRQTATMYKIVTEEGSVLITGHIYPELSDAQLEAIGMIDLMVVPVGGNGYTLDSVGALKLIKKIEPKVVVPTHYSSDHLNFPVPQQTLDEALKGLAMEAKEKTTKLRLKQTEFADSTQLIILEQV